MTVLARDETALAIYQANRNDRAICEALLDEYLAPAEYTATLDAVRTAIREPGVCVMGTNRMTEAGEREAALMEFYAAERRAGACPLVANERMLEFSKRLDAEAEAKERTR